VGRSHPHSGNSPVRPELATGTGSTFALTPTVVHAPEARYVGAPRIGTIVPVKPKRLAFFQVGRELRERVNKRRRST
jgi:hypothetical protein